MYKNELTFEPCKITKSHAKKIMAWRNDPKTLSMFYHQEPKIWEKFWPEYCETYFLHNSKIHPIFAVLNGKKIGFLKFSPITHPINPSKSTVDISINLSPDIRNKGLGRKILVSCNGFLSKHGVQSVYAEILSHNVSSIKAFQAAGFLFIEQKTKHIDHVGTYNICCFLNDDLQNMEYNDD